MLESDFITVVKNRTMETDITRNMVKNKITNEAAMPKVSKVLDQKLAPLPRKFRELILEESLTNVHLLVKNLFTGKIPNLQLTGRLAHFRVQQELANIDPRLENFIYSKGVHNTILESSSAKEHSKTGDNVQTTGTVNKSGDYGNAG